MADYPSSSGTNSESTILAILPAFCEAGRIGAVVAAVREAGLPVLVVDDGSGDGTAAEARAAGAEVVELPENRGKGVALDRGFAYARAHGYQAVVTLDADGQHDPADLAGFLRVYDGGAAPVVIGNRFGDVSTMPRLRLLTNRFMSGLLSLAMGQDVPDTQNGYRLYRLDVLEGLELRALRFAAESEILLHLASRGVPLASVEVATIYGDEKSKIRPVRDTLRFARMLGRFWWSGPRRRRAGETAGVVPDAGSAYTARSPRNSAESPSPPPTAAPPGISVVAIRGALGGVLMGLANLVPGISGGTMLLAAGVYPAFIDAVAEATTLRFRARSIALLGAVVGAAALAILLLAGLVKGLVVEHRWAMYSLFIGLTLGGLPVVWRMARPARPATWIGAAAGAAAMAVLGWMQMTGVGAEGGGAADLALLFLAGVAGASAMILPGVSGGYLLLVLGQYVPILSAIDRFKSALGAGDFTAAVEIGLRVGLPVGLGVVIGIAAVSNLLRWLLRRAPHATLGVLLGLLVGAVAGLWPFQEGTPPLPGELFQGQIMTETLISTLQPEDFPTQLFQPSAAQVGGAIALFITGLAGTICISRLGNRESDVS